MKAVIFDLDGTLLNTVPDLLFSMNYSLEQLGRPTVSAVQLKAFIGNGARNLVIRCLGGNADEDTVSKLYDLYGQTYLQNLTVRTEYYNGISDVLLSLVNKGIKISVLSNKPDEQTRKIIAHYFPNIPFTCVMGKMDGMPLKPDPTTALMIAEKMGASPEETVFVGDSPEDFKTAQNGGMKCISVLWGYRSKEAYSDLLQNNFAENTGELLSLLENI